MLTSSSSLELVDDFRSSDFTLISTACGDVARAVLRDGNSIIFFFGVAAD